MNCEDSFLAGFNINPGSDLFTICFKLVHTRRDLQVVVTRVCLRRLQIKNNICYATVLVQGVHNTAISGTPLICCNCQRVSVIVHSTGKHSAVTQYIPIIHQIRSIYSLRNHMECLGSSEFRGRVISVCISCEFVFQKRKRESDFNTVSIRIGYITEITLIHKNSVRCIRLAIHVFYSIMIVVIPLKCEHILRYIRRNNYTECSG